MRNLTRFVLTGLKSCDRERMTAYEHDNAPRCLRALPAERVITYSSKYRLIIIIIAVRAPRYYVCNAQTLPGKKTLGRRSDSLIFIISVSTAAPLSSVRVPR